MTTPTGPHWRTLAAPFPYFGGKRTIAAAVRRGELVGRWSGGMVWVPPGATIADRRNGQVLEQRRAAA